MYTTKEVSNMCARSRCWGEMQDCSVIAIAIALSISYAAAWYAMRKVGRVYQEGVSITQINKALNNLGYGTAELSTEGTWQALYENKGDSTLLIYTTKHVAVLKDNRIHEQIGATDGKVWHICEVKHSNGDTL